MRESRQGENGGVISDEEPPKKAPAVLPGFRDIKITAPEPLPSLSMLDQGRRRRVMNHHQIRVQVQTLCGSLVDLEVDLLHLIGEVFVLALKGIRQSSGHLKEFLVACQDFPASIDAQRVEHRHHSAKGFRHATTITPRADVQETLPCDLIAQAVQKFDSAFRRIVSILVQFLSHRVSTRNAARYTTLPSIP